MKRKLLLISLLVASATVIAQTNGSDNASQHQEPEAAVPAPTTAKPVEPLFGFMKASREGGTSLNSRCSLQDTTRVNKGSTFVLLRQVKCSKGSGYSNSTGTFYEVLYQGKPLLIEESMLLASDDERLKLSNLSEGQIEASKAYWSDLSLSINLNELKKALSAVTSTGKYGITIVDFGIFDVSEHTEGTGFNVKLLNTGRKTIKYITFSILGLNAVNDSVRERFRGSATMTLRGIGPIEPDSSASYSRDYMWMTDTVQFVKLQQVKLEYMDGTSKVLSDIGRLRVKSEHLELLGLD